MKRTVLVTAVVLAMVAGLSSATLANSTWSNLFNSTYGTVGTALDTCSVCHTSVPARNPYGDAFFNAGHDLGAIANFDSDGDGFTNIVEISALTLPGTATDHPAASDTSLFSDFGATGLYQWDGATWKKINPGVPSSMAASGPILYASFTGSGLYQWNGRAWKRINTNIPESMVASGSNLYANFTGLGLYQWDGSAWSRINSNIPQSMAASGSILYANFAGLGLYQWNGSAWSRINPNIPANMETGF